MAETVRIEIPIETIDHTDPELSHVTRNFERMEKAAESANGAAKKANSTVTQFDRQAQKTEKSLASWVKEKYEILLEAKDKITPILSILRDGLRSFAGKTWSVTMKAVDLITSPVRGMINLLKNPVFQVGAVLGVSIGLKDTIETYKDFEAAMSQVQAISGATGSEVVKLTDKAKEMGATTKFTAEESAEAFNYMAMAGWKTGDMLNGIEGILNLAAASGEDLATTSDIVTDALTAFQLSASDAGHFSDVLAAAASNANTTVSGMGETFKYAGSMAGALGYSIEDVALMTGLMANTGVKATMAGTSLNAIFTRLSTNTNGAADAMSDLGIAFFTSEGNARDLSDVMAELRKATANMTAEQKSNLANTIAGTQAQKGLLAILNASEEDYNKLADAINHADGAAVGMSKTMLDNLQGSLTLLQSAVDGVKISFGERLSPYVRSLADWLTDQMPAVEKGLDEFMDWIDTKIDQMQRKFHAIADTKEWQDADFFGKVKIAWDEFIAEPFSEWWNSTGKAKFADFAQDIGAGIGTGLKVGVMTMLGIDIGESLDEGVSIGVSFAKGFSEGFDFDLIQSKLWKGMKNLFADASKLLPGGEAVGLSSLFSALLIHKIAVPLVGMGTGVFQVGKALFGKGESGTSIMGSLMGHYSLAAEAAGTGMAEGSGLFGFLGKAGLLFGSGATTSTGLIAAGTAGVAGTVAGGVSIISGLMDAYQAIRSEDAAEKTAYGSSSGLKLGGAAIGAMLGSMILPGLGTAIGTGIGGTLGSLVGKVVKKDYQKKVEQEQKEVEELQKQAEKAQKILEVTGCSVDEMKLKSDVLIQAMNDSEVSAEQFIAMFEEECVAVAKGAFGEISLSLEEVKKAASDITFADMATELERFLQVSSETEAAWNHLTSAVSSVKKENWKVSLGIKLSDSDQRSYRSEIDNFVTSAKSYLEEKHYEATLAFQLLTNEEVDISGLNRFYGSLKGKIETANEELQRVMSEALSDGIISTEDRILVKIGGVEYEMDEASALAELQKRITDVTDKLATAQTEAQFETLQIKYKDAALDLDSFHAVQKELQANVSAAEAQYEEALTVTLTNLKLEVIDGAITEEEYTRAVTEATQGYYAKIDELYARVSDFNLENIAAAFQTELSGILPEMKGTTEEKLKTLLEDALLIQPDVKKWTPSDVIHWMGLDQLDLDEVQQTTIAMELKQIAFSVPEGTKEQILQEYQNQVPTKEELMAAMDFTQFSYEEWNDLLKGFDPSGAEESFFGITDSMQPLVEADAKDFGALCERYAEQLHLALEKNKDTEAFADFKEQYMGELLEITDEAMQNETLLNESHLAGRNLGEAVNTGITERLAEGSSLIRAAAESAIQSAFSNPFQVMAQINLTGNYQLRKEAASQGGYATGGYVSGGPQLSWLAEEGYGEFVIPTNPSRRARALELYEQAGAALGVSAYADGGYVGGFIPRNTASNYDLFADVNRNASLAYYDTTEGNYRGETAKTYEPSSVGMSGIAGGTPIEVKVELSPEFVIHGGDGQSEEDIMQVIRKHLKEMADELGGEIAANLKEVFSNMPLKEA